MLEQEYPFDRIIPEEREVTILLNFLLFIVYKIS